MNVEENLPAFGEGFVKSCLLKTGYSSHFKIVAFWTFHISIIVNTTAMIVNSSSILYLCVEVIICQSDKSPERLIISPNPSIWETSNLLKLEKEWKGHSPSFLGDLENPSLSKQDIPNLSKLWHFGPSTLLYLSILQLW